MAARLDLPKVALRNALRSAGGHIGLAARDLRISVKTLRRRLKEDPTLHPGVGIEQILPRSVIEAPSYRANFDYGHWYGVELEPRILPVGERNALVKKVRSALAAAQAEKEYLASNPSHENGNHCDKG